MHNNSPNLATAQVYIISRQKVKSPLQYIEKGEVNAKDCNESMQHVPFGKVFDRVQFP